MQTLPSAIDSWTRCVGWGRRHFIGIVAIAATLTLAAILTFRFASAFSAASFGFLFDKTGWDISFSFLPYSPDDPYWWVLVVGLANTIGAGAITICTATLLGFAVGVARLSSNKLLADIGRTFVDFIRNVPLILQAAFWYAVVLHLPPIRSAYSIGDAIFLSNRGLFLPKFSGAGLVLAFVALFGVLVWTVLTVRNERREMRDAGGGPSPMLFACVVGALAIAGIAYILLGHASVFTIDRPVRAGLNFSGGLRFPPEFVALILAITIYRGAFIAEVFRGGLKSVSIGQIDAAQSLGLRPWMVLWTIRLPLALISIVPPMSSEFIIIMKVTSIGIVVGFMDLFAVSSNAAMMTGQTLPVLITMIVIYVLLNYAILVPMNLVNERLKLPGHDK